MPQKDFMQDKKIFSSKPINKLYKITNLNLIMFTKSY